MLTTARDLVLAFGVTVSLEDLSLEDVIRHAGVPRSSVYRIWPYKGDFVDDLLCHMAGPDWFGAAAFDQDTIDLALKVAADHEQMLGTPGGRRAVVLEAARQAVLRYFRAIVTSREWQIYIALVATAGSARDDQATRTNRRSARRLTGRISYQNGGVLPAHGRRARPAATEPRLQLHPPRRRRGRSGRRTGPAADPRQGAARPRRVLHASAPKSRPRAADQLPAARTRHRWQAGRLVAGRPRIYRDPRHVRRAGP